MNTKLRSQIVKYSTENAYIAEHFATAICSTCRSEVFRLVMNEDEGVAVRICTSCEGEHAIGDSNEYLEDVEELYRIECTCDANQFKIMAGVALYEGSEDVRWFYLGCECVKCRLSGVYGDWKNEFIGYQALLDNV
ncbi:hypothetical protein N9153_01525 [Planctomicrobium sp.]|jgi:hypothetical protein|nr:hypothetical protein [Planctomicrobium sp.]MDB4439584.1 hypothetical protein [Planctomicrobium sp.]